jgi:ribosome-associated protein
LLRWRLSANTTIPAEIMSRLRSQAKGRITADGELLIQSQRYRDQDRNRQDCLDKLKELLLQASVKPKSRRPTRPTRGSKERRLAEKKHRAKQKARRRPSAD